MNLQTLNVRRIVTIAAILSLALYYLLAWSRMLGNLYERTGSDFMGFYTFGRISQTLGYPFLYRIEEQQKLQEQIVGHPVTPIFYTHLPFIAPLARILVVEDYLASFKRWALVLLFLNTLNVSLLVKFLQASKFSRWNLVVLALGAWLFDPTFSGFMNGQDTAILLTGAALWGYGLFSGRDFLAGLALSLTTVRPQVALFLAIPFLFHRRQVFWGFALGGAALALFSMALLGKDGTLQFIESIRYIEGTVWRENHALDMPTISGVIRRNFTIVNSAGVQKMVWLAYVLGIAGFGLWWRSRPFLDERHLGLLTLAAIFFVPYAHYHDLILLLIPVFCLIRLYQRLSLLHQNQLALLPLAVSWLLNLGFAGSGQMKFPIVYAVMALLAYLLVKAGQIPGFLKPSAA